MHSEPPATAMTFAAKYYALSHLADGTYEIPEGNFFPKEHRIPARRFMSWDAVILSEWGSISRPVFCIGEMWAADSGVDKEDRAQWAIILNQALQAGNFGWPVCGGTKVYRDYDFEKKSAHYLILKTQSTILQTLVLITSPFNPSMIWYSYDRSKGISWVGTGGKNPRCGIIVNFMPVKITCLIFSMGVYSFTNGCATGFILSNLIARPQPIRLARQNPSVPWIWY